jgi:hypothetical protein
MSSFRPRTALRASVALTAVLLCAVRQADAQCSTAGIAPISARMTEANPLQAVLVASFSPPRDRKLPAPRLLEPRAVARDSQGRVRFDRVVGKAHRETGPDAGSDIEMHSVIICDPQQRKIIQLDNANRAATVRPLRLLAVHSGPSAIPFCRVPTSTKTSANMSIERLGHRTIEGFDAIGWRITSHVAVAEATPEAMIERIHETWCSEDLGAILLSLDGGSEDGRKLQIAMTQIQRAEPDPSLFEIPPDDTVSDTLQPSRYVGSAAAQPPEPSSPQIPLVTR